MTVGNPPPAHSSCFATYDSTGNRIIMGFGNNESTQFADLWALQL